jgi:2,3-bisphosphoglycerate-independent phosphoglycerate mutase
MNFRADRAREITLAFVLPGLTTASERRCPCHRALGRFVCLREYDATLPAPVAFGSDELHNTLAEVDRAATA